MIGQTVAHYRIEQKLGGGGMGVVYKAIDLGLGRPVALKFLPPDLARDRQFLERFQREARAASGLDHSNICTIYGFDETEGKPFLVMQYLEGSTLEKHLEQAPLKIDQLLDFALQIGSALQAAHENGIIHRDIKPANIFVTPKNQIKILDFGLAKPAEAVAGAATQTPTAVDFGLTAPGSPLGTITYMSPEQARCEALDGRTDIYSLGVVLYEMATGKRPFEGQSAAVLFDQLLNQEPARPSELNPGLPSEIEKIILKALRKDRDERYESASPLLAELEGAKQAAEAGNGASLPLPDQASRGQASRIGWNPKLAAAAAAFLIPLVVLLYWAIPGREIASPMAEPVSVAVLPFDSLSPEPENEYFSDGLTEDIISHLAKIGELNVISRSSVMGYKNQERDVAEIGRELGVSVFLEGSVRRAGDQIRIVAQLIDVGSDAYLWGQIYDREISDIFQIQSDIAEQIASALHVQLSPRERRLIDKVPTHELPAYEYYLKGKQAYGRYSRGGNETAIAYFQKALDEDSDFAPAYAGLGSAYLQRVQNYGFAREWLERSLEMSRKAIELDEQLADGYIALAAAHFHGGEVRKALQANRKAVELNPSSSSAVSNLAFNYLYTGNLVEAMKWARRDLQINPAIAFSHLRLGTVHLHLTEDKQAEKQLRLALDMDPGFGWALYFLTYAKLLQGDQKAARETMERALTMRPGFSPLAYLSSTVQLLSGNWEEARAEAVRAMEQDVPFFSWVGLDLGCALIRLNRQEEAMKVVSEEIGKQRERINAGSQLYDPRLFLAMALAMQGDREAALDWFEEAIEAGFRDYRLAQLHPSFDSLRDDERFRGMMEELQADVERQRREVSPLGNRGADPPAEARRIEGSGRRPGDARSDRPLPLCRPPAGSVEVQSEESIYLTVMRQKIVSMSPVRFQLTSFPATTVPQ